MLSIYGTEQIGISAEVALADLSGVHVDQKYRQRGRAELIEHLKPELAKVLPRIPMPIRHVAEGQSPVDFLLSGNQTLSVKSNMREAGKMAPQNIGQPTSQTFWSRLPHLIPEGVSVGSLTYSDSARLFKSTALIRTPELLDEYWKNLFDCDFLIHVFDVLDEFDNLTKSPKVRLFSKATGPRWEDGSLTFTKTLQDWNESCTVKFNGVAIGEFQVHNNRNCFKFRFNLKGLIQAGLL